MDDAADDPMSVADPRRSNEAAAASVVPASGVPAAAAPAPAVPAPAVPASAVRAAVTPTPSRRIPAAALSERNARARAKGLPGLLIEGGEDPVPEVGRREERRYLRLLLVMVAAIVLSGFVLGVVGLVVGGPAPS